VWLFSYLYRSTTRTGVVVGTLGYAAPELLLGGESMSAADVFVQRIDLAAVVFSALSGAHPGWMEPKPFTY
jgi:serine/threonine protein kinase